MMQRIHTTRKLLIMKMFGYSKVLELDVLRQTTKAVIRASRSSENLTTLVSFCRHTSSYPKGFLETCFPSVSVRWTLADIPRPVKPSSGKGLHVL